MSTKARDAHDCHGMERALCLDVVADPNDEIYVNAHSPWMPAWGRGMYGGAMIAHSLVAAQATVPQSFDVHSLHSHFILPADPTCRITYTVERVRDGYSFILRVVHATQQEKRIFTATLSFVKQPSPGRKTLHHANGAPEGMGSPPREQDVESLLSPSMELGESRPCDVVRCEVGKREKRHDSKLRHWIRARGPMGHGIRHRQATGEESIYHVNAAAIAYMSDNYFIGTVARVHNAARFTDQRTRDRALKGFRGSQRERTDLEHYFEALADEEARDNAGFLGNDNPNVISMMATLNHTIFFHNCRLFPANDWMMAEMDAGWAGDDRGLATQRIWSADGVLIATCIQEGVVRLHQNSEKTHL